MADAREPVMRDLESLARAEQAASIPRERAMEPRHDLEWGEEAHPCGLCGKLTPYVDWTFVCFLCPHPCYHGMWRIYVEACRR
jgi:hypothetical protein